MGNRVARFTYDAQEGGLPISGLAGFAVEKLWEDGELVLSHGVQQGGSTRVLILSPVSDVLRLGAPANPSPHSRSAFTTFRTNL